MGALTLNKNLHFAWIPMGILGSFVSWGTQDSFIHVGGRLFFGVTLYYFVFVSYFSPGKKRLALFMVYLLFFWKSVSIIHGLFTNRRSTLCFSGAGSIPQLFSAIILVRMQHLFLFCFAFCPEGMLWQELGNWPYNNVHAFPLRLSEYWACFGWITKT